MVITGSDMRNSATVEHLRALDIPVAIGHRGENVQGAELVIRTAAVHDETPKSPPPAPRASPSLSGPRPGEPS